MQYNKTRLFIDIIFLPLSIPLAILITVGYGAEYIRDSLTVRINKYLLNKP